MTGVQEIVQKVVEDVDKIRDLKIEVQREETALPEVHQKVRDLLMTKKV